MKKTFTAAFIVLALAVAAAVAFTGCGTSDAADGGETAGDGGSSSDGGSGDNDGGGAGPVPVGEFCSKVTEWYCSVIVKCMPGLQTGDCAKILPLDCADFTLDPAKVDYDENKTGDCFVEMNKLGCDSNADKIPVCQEAIVGKVAADGDCSTGFDCAEGLTCYYDGMNGCGQCVEEGAVGDSCDGVPCGSGLECDDTQKCADAPGPGESCGTGDGAISCSAEDAVAQVWCKPDSEGAATGKCTKKGVKGGACASDDECAWLYACVEGACALRPRTSEACSFTVEAGYSKGQYTACLYMGSEFCKEGTTEGEGTCTAVPGKDAACGGADDSILCGRGLWCDDLALGGTCKDKGGDGATCNPQYNGADCASGECDSGTCAAKVVCQ